MLTDGLLSLMLPVEHSVVSLSPAFLYRRWQKARKALKDELSLNVGKD